MNSNLIDMEINLWEYHYISCEGNNRWSLALCPIDWTEEDVESKVMEERGYDDAPAEFISADITNSDREDAWLATDYTN